MPLNIDIGDGADALTINQLRDALDGTYWTDGLDATLGSGDLEVDVASGTGSVDGSSVSTTSTETVNFSGDVDPDDPRKATIYVDDSGVDYALGAPAPSDPEDETRFRTWTPAPPASVPGAVVAEVWLPAGASSLTADDVRDRRVPNAAAGSSNDGIKDTISASLTGDDSELQGYTRLTGGEVRAGSDASFPESLYVTIPHQSSGSGWTTASHRSTPGNGSVSVDVLGGPSFQRYTTSLNVRGDSTMTWRPDGTSFYSGQSEYQEGYVVQADLARPWDPTSITSTNELDTYSNTGGVSAVQFNSDGTEMLVLAGNLYNYSLSTAWDISTASSGYDGSTDMSADFAFSPDRSMCYGISGGTIYEYDDGFTRYLHSPSNTFSVPNYSNLTAIDVAPDGTSVIVCDQDSDNNYYLREFRMSTPWDLSTASECFQYYVHRYGNVSGFGIADNGRRLYTSALNGSTQADMQEHRLPESGGLTTLAVSDADPGADISSLSGDSPIAFAVEFDYPGSGEYPAVDYLGASLTR